MEIVRLETSNYSVICPECNNILKFKINPEKFIVEGECRNGHSFNKISFYTFKSYIKKTSSIKLINCFKCFNKKNSKTYKCQTCNKLFCLNCINQHLKEEKHSNAKSFIKENKICHKHNTLFYFFCNECNAYICESCRLEHKNHEIISLLDIFPNKAKKEYINTKTLSFENSINKMINKFNNMKEEINERFEKLENYFNFLLNINNRLFKNYNYSIFDISNYENFNYIYNFIANDKLFDEKIYLDYIFHNTSLKDINNKEKEIINREKNIMKINSNNIKNLLNIDFSKLNYFKDNLFYIKDINNRYSDNYIKMYEFKDFNFQYIANYNNHSLSKIESFKLSKYGNYFIINQRRKKNIQFLEYDNIQKELILSKKEIKSKRNSYFDMYFSDVIDCIDGSIITSAEEGVVLWEKYKKKYYKQKYIFPKFYYKLFNINDKIFLARESDFITFFNIDKFEPIKTLDIQYSIYSIYNTFTVGDIIIIVNENNEYILISLKYFDIIQIIKFDEKYLFLKVINNYFIQYIKDNKKLRLIKQIYNEKKGIFEKENTTTLNINIFSDFSKIIMTDNDELFIEDSETMSVYINVV